MEKTQGFSQASEALLTERGLEVYKKLLAIDETDIGRWSVILDLGAGLEQNLAKDLPNKKVISIDPRLALPLEEDLGDLDEHEISAREHARAFPEKRTLAALGQALPLRDASIDAVLGLHSVTQYIETEEEMRDMLLEVVRVLKPGGEARFYPVVRGDSLELVQRSVDALINSGATFVAYPLFQNDADAKGLYVIEKSS